MSNFCLTLISSSFAFVIHAIWILVGKPQKEMGEGGPFLWISRKSTATF